MIVYLVTRKTVLGKYADRIGVFGKYNIYRMRFYDYRQIRPKGYLFESIEKIFTFIRKTTRRSKNDNK